MFRRSFLALVLISFSPIVATHAAEPLISGPGVAISKKDIASELAYQPQPIRSQIVSQTEKMRQFVDDIYRRERLAAEARTLELTDYERFRLARAQKEELVAIIIDRQAADLAAQEHDFESLAQERYLAHRDSYRIPARARVHHILLRVPSEEERDAVQRKAQEIRSDIEAGGDFSELAKEYSDDKGSAQKGGDLGWIRRGQTVPPFEKAAFGLKEPNQLAGPVETRFGFHIIRLDEYEPARQQPFEEIKDGLVQKVREEWLRAQLRAWRDRVTDPKQATVDVDALNAYLKTFMAPLPQPAVEQPDPK